MPDNVKNILIGFFVIAASAVVVFILLFLHPTVGDDREILFVRFANIDKITVGTRVTFGGKPVGEVAVIREVNEAANPRKERDGHVYSYELELRIDSSVKVYKSDEISSKTSGLLGEKSVAITPLAPPPGQPLEPVTSKDILYAYESGGVEDALKEFQSLAVKIGHAVDEITLTAKEIGGKRLWDNINAVAQNIHEISDALNKDNLIEKTVVNLENLSSKAIHSWTTVDNSLNHIQDMAQSGAVTLGRIEKGEGTIGELVVNKDIYLRLKGILSKADTTMNDINHYGLLFNSDKGWQRLRARRLNLLARLSTPQEFSNFFNDEMDQINTSLSRVSMVLERMNEDGSLPCFIEDPSYSRPYAELLDKVADMEEALEMYNQQAIDACLCE